MRALFYTANVYSLTAPVLIANAMNIGNNKMIRQEHTNSSFQMYNTPSMNFLPGFQMFYLQIILNIM